MKKIVIVAFLIALLFVYEAQGSREILRKKRGRESRNENDAVRPILPFQPYVRDDTDTHQGKVKITYSGNKKNRGG